MEEEDIKLVVEGQNGDEEIMLDFHVPNEVRTKFAQEVAIQAVHTEFILSFFEVRLPIVQTNMSEKDVASLIKTICVSRVALSAERIPSLIEALQSRLAKFNKEREEFNKEVENGSDKD